MVADPLSYLSALVAELPENTPVSARRLASGSAFVTRSKTHFGLVTPARPLIALVLEGRKIVTHAGVRHVLGRGDVLVAPRLVPYECSVLPQPRFCAFVTEIAADASAAFARDNPRLSVSAQLGAFAVDRVHVVRADPTVLQAVAHFAATLLTPSAHASLIRHRLEDLILALSLQIAPPVSEAPDLLLTIRALLRTDLAAAWPAETVARKVSMSPSTLRRQLAAVGVSLRDLRAEERMSVAAELLRQRGARVADVAAKCGYESASKFAKQFRKHHGRAPSETGANSVAREPRGRARLRA